MSESVDRPETFTNYRSSHVTHRYFEPRGADDGVGMGEFLGHDRIVDSGLCRPMTAVARGAAIYATSLDGELGDDKDFSLVTSYDLGTAVSAGERKGFRAIIRRNATLPAEGSANFYPDTPGASFVRVPVIEVGGSGRPLHPGRSGGSRRQPRAPYAARHTGGREDAPYPLLSAPGVVI
ncbi:hypothetical protein ACIRU5_34910 [Streptomyces misionensis]|uniref:hypothetical protein n=1 Tax=Streptomyces misionensis TaxID=67331 RepID=UPI0038273798